MGQCLTAMKNKLERLDDYKDLEDKGDMIGLLEKIQEIAFSADNAQYKFWSMQQSMQMFGTLRQQNKECLVAFYKCFTNQVEVTERVWGPLITAKMKGKSTEEQKKAREKFLACMFLASVDRKLYKKPIDDLNNDF